MIIFLLTQHSALSFPLPTAHCPLSSSSLSTVPTMTNAKRTAANQRNALRSSGPRTDAGKRRSSVNAMRHGLTTSIETSLWWPHLQSLQALLESDGLNPPEARELALCILNYERNVQSHRKLHHSIRHLRRAANQLTKKCKSLTI